MRAECRYFHLTLLVGRVVRVESEGRRRSRAAHDSRLDITQKTGSRSLCNAFVAVRASLLIPPALQLASPPRTHWQRRRGAPQQPPPCVPLEPVLFRFFSLPSLLKASTSTTTIACRPRPRRCSSLNHKRCWCSSLRWSCLDSSRSSRCPPRRASFAVCIALFRNPSTLSSAASPFQRHSPSPPTSLSPSDPSPTIRILNKNKSTQNGVRSSG